MQGRRDLKDPEAYILWTDASKVYGDSFNLGHLLQTAILRQRPLAAILRSPSIDYQSYKVDFPVVRLDSPNICPKIAFRNSPVSTSDSVNDVYSTASGGSDEAFALPMVAFSSSQTSSEGFSKAMNSAEVCNLHMCSQGEWFGFELGRIWTAEAWFKDRQEEERLILQANQPKQVLPERFRSSALWDYRMVRKEHPGLCRSYGRSQVLLQQRNLHLGRLLMYLEMLSTVEVAKQHVGPMPT